MELELPQGINYIKEKINSLLKEKDFILIGIAGGSGAGKTTLAKTLNFKVLNLDDYYITGGKNMNFDHPEALDLNLLKQHLKELKQGKTINKPVYDFKTHSNIGKEPYTSEKVIIIEGLFALHSIIRDELDLHVFLEASENTRLRRRINRDIRERGRSKDKVIKQWNETVNPMYKAFIEPTKQNSIIILNNSKKLLL